MTATVRVRARSTILGLVYGEEATLELTDQVDRLIHRGMLELLDEADDRAIIAPQVATTELEALQIKATRLGIKVDGRWSAETLRRKITEKIGELGPIEVST